MIQVFITGNLGQDCGGVKYDQNNNPRVSFSVAARAKQGRQNEQTVWFKCSLFGKRAEGVAQYLTKGKQVAVMGELSENAWTTNDGEKRKDLDVWVNELDLLGPPPSQQAPHTPPPAYNQAPPQGQQRPQGQPPAQGYQQPPQGQGPPQQQPLPQGNPPAYQPSDGADQRGPQGNPPPYGNPPY